MTTGDGVGGIAEGWTVVPERRGYRWAAFVPGRSLGGMESDRGVGESKARSALLGLKGAQRP